MPSSCPRGGKKLSAGQLLERFLFPRNRHHDFIHKLSGGERKRLHLLRVLMANPNFLVFDEPTNDLDVFTLGILEEFLLDFTGCLVAGEPRPVFHGQAGRPRLRPRRRRWRAGLSRNYTQYRTAADAEDKAAASERAAEAKAAAARAAEEGPAAPKGDYSQRLSYNEKREYEGLEDVIAGLEARKAELETAMSAPDIGHEDMTELATNSVWSPPTSKPRPSAGSSSTSGLTRSSRTHCWSKSTTNLADPGLGLVWHVSTKPCSTSPGSRA